MLADEADDNVKRATGRHRHNDLDRLDRVGILGKRWKRSDGGYGHGSHGEA
jgi:hypothetical protein